VRLRTQVSVDTTAPLFIGEHLALDFINSRYGVDAGRREYLVSDEAVLDWLHRAGVWPSTVTLPATSRRGSVLRSALELRECALELVRKRKARTTGDPAILNQFLAVERSHARVTWKKGQAPQLVREYASDILLVPVALAVAQFLAEGDFELIRQCESTDCTLWFYDRTKAHRRRWCSMALCGNRAKVTAFRARQKQ
jgi:predicted RNA-binding Zn ribbon-like protein